MPSDTSRLTTPPHDGVSITLEDLVALSRAPALRAPAVIRARRAGGHTSHHKGRGMEFDEARPYVPGDDVRALDWKVTARTGHAHTKLFREERERPVFVAVDFRPAMFFATRGAYKSVLAARLAALIAWSTQEGGDRVGGEIVSADGLVELKPRHGRSAVLEWLKNLASVHESQRQRLARQPAAVPDLSQALARLGLHARPGSLIYVLSDFRGLDAAGEMALGRLAGHCEVVPVLIYDPFECSLPGNGLLRLGDGRREAVVDAAALGALHAQRFQQRRQRLQSWTRRHGLRLLECSTNADPWTLLSSPKP